MGNHMKHLPLIRKLLATGYKRMSLRILVSRICWGLALAAVSMITYVASSIIKIQVLFWLLIEDLLHAHTLLVLQKAWYEHHGARSSLRWSEGLGSVGPPPHTRFQQAARLMR